MSSLSFSLKNAINRTDNPSADGLFAYGKYLSDNTFTIFTDYEYTDGTPYSPPPYDTSKVLAWKGATEFPHIGFENIQGNSNITPQPFPTFGIYVHPYFSTVREDVGVRFNCPVSCNLTVVSKVQKDDLECGDGIAYRILKNGSEAQIRTLVAPSTTPTTITSNISVNQGDILDFIVDVGDNANSFCDDVALEVSLTLNYSKLPIPTITTTSITCATTEIEGSGFFVPSNVTAVLYSGDEALAYTQVSQIGGTYQNYFKFTGLDLTNYASKQLKIRFQSTTDQPSDFVTFNVGGTCATFLKPQIIEIDNCNSIQKSVKPFTVTSDTKGVGVVIDDDAKLIIASVLCKLSTGGGYVASGYDFDDLVNTNNSYKTIFIPLGYDVAPAIPAFSTTTSCTKTYKTYQEVSGFVNGIKTGVALLYEADFGEEDLPMMTAPINDGKFVFRGDMSDLSGKYIVYAIKIDF